MKFAKCSVAQIGGFFCYNGYSTDVSVLLPVKIFSIFPPRFIWHLSSLAREDMLIWFVREGAGSTASGRLYVILGIQVKHTINSPHFSQIKYITDLLCKGKMQYASGDSAPTMSGKDL